MLEKLLLLEIANNGESFFSEDYRNKMAKELGIKSLTASTIQSSLKTLQRKELIGKFSERSTYFIDDPNFKAWLLEKDNA